MKDKSLAEWYKKEGKVKPQHMRVAKTDFLLGIIVLPLALFSPWFVVKLAEWLLL